LQAHVELCTVQMADIGHDSETKKPNLWTRKRKSVQAMALVQRAWHFKKTSQPDLPGREDC